MRPASRISPTRSFVVVFAAIALAVSAANAGAQSALKQRRFKFFYTATVDEIPAGAKSVGVWLPYPQSDESQDIHQIKVDAPGSVEIEREPEHGNLALHNRATGPSAPFTVRLEVLATRRENAGRHESLTPAELKPYLRAEPLVPLDGPVRALGKEAVKGKSTAIQKARAIYEKVTGMVKYDKSGTGWGRGDALYVCDAKRGNCTDFHALIIGMARSQGIPARFAIGFSIPEGRGSGEITGYHCWAELYINGRWLPVDSSEAAKALANGDPAKKDYFFGHHDENRLEFSRGRHLTLSPRQQGAPLNFFVYPYAEVDGKKHAAILTKFAYEDVTGR